jgi:hypothetical protein
MGISNGVLKPEADVDDGTDTCTTGFAGLGAMVSRNILLLCSTPRYWKVMSVRQ